MEHKAEAPGPQWVNLTRYWGENLEYAYMDDDEWRWRWDRTAAEKDKELLALFDKQHAEAGGKLRILLYVPHDEARLLFTIEGRTVEDYVVLQTTGTVRNNRYRIVEIPIKDRYRPNFYLCGRILWGSPEQAVANARRLVERLQKAREMMQKADDADDPRWCRVDVLSPNAPRGEDKLKVEVAAERTEYRPGDEVNVSLKVTGLDGRPREAEVSLAAVDASVYAFGEDALDALPAAFADARPPRRFLPKIWRSYSAARWSEGLAAKAQEQMQDAMQRQLRAIAQAAAQAKEAAQAQMQQNQDASRALSESDAGTARLAELQRELGRRRALAQFGELPRLAMELPRLRTDFRETAAWQPHLRAGADGLIRTKFRLPESLTAFRLSAVGLTKQTEIGIGRGDLRVSMPLSAQLFVPRFAVEGDRLLAVALLHNNTKEDIACDAAFDVAGARIEEAQPGANGWQPAVSAGADGAVGAGQVKVPAGKNARVALWLAADRAGAAQLSFRAAGGGYADAETRPLPVRPLGRAREVFLTGDLRGATTVALPDGFMADDLRVALSRGGLARALDGIGYLVDYPYGCVEQTMSRFLPSVMVKHAALQAAVTLPPEIGSKLPDVLEKGLERLYRFQHEDGGWGWWEKDQTSNPMTAYVLYGLTRCKLTGTPVDAGALQRGYDYLQKALESGALADPSGQLTHGNRSLTGDDLEAEAWQILALAGRADEAKLKARAARALDPKTAAGPATAERLALACRAAGLAEEGERLAAGAAKWQAEATDDLALKLSAQLAFGARLEDCEVTAQALLKRKQGDHWENTRATSAAIESLAQMLRLGRAQSTVTAVRVAVGGRAVLNLTKPEELSAWAYHVGLTAADLPRREALPVELRAESSEAVVYTIAATGIQKQDKVEPISNGISVRREYETLDGRPLGGQAAAGQVVVAKLSFDLDAPRGHLIVEDPRPAGFEYADEQLAGPGARGAAHVEFRDDRLCAFYTALPAGRTEIRYYLRAETPGAFNVLPARAYPMYDDKIRGESGAQALGVNAP